MHISVADKPRLSRTEMNDTWSQVVNDSTGSMPVCERRNSITPIGFCPT